MRDSITLGLTVVVLVMTLLLPVGGVFAQDDLLPRTIGDGPATVEVVTGIELLAGLDPDDDSFDDQVAELERLLEATGADVADLTVASAYADGVLGGPTVAALRVADADRATLTTAVVSALWSSLEQPRQVAAEIEGRPLILLHDDAVADDIPHVIYSHGDTVWLLHGSSDEIAALLAQLP